MTETNTQDLKRRSLISVMSLFFQSGYSALLGLGANLVLTILLTPDIFGLYGTVLSIVALLNYFSDIGLAGSLIQKKEITDDDVRTTFTFQQILIITIITIGYLATSFIQSFYKLPAEGIYLYWALLISFFISSLKTIPSVMLERKVIFRKIVAVQIIENTVFYVLVIVLALSGLGIRSFTYAVVARAVVGLIAIYSFSYWQPQIGISRSSLKSLLAFGVPFQASSFLALFKDELINLYLAKVLGFHTLGYIIWAKKWAEAPIRIIMDNVTRVLFPVIARIQDDKEKVGRIMEKIIYYQTLLLAPILLGMALMMRPLVELIPRYEKWEPALPAFYILVASAFLSTYSSPFINLFNALGKARIPFTFMLIWTVTTWIFTPVLTRMYGLYGFPITQLILALTSVLVLLKARQFISFKVVSILYPAILSAIGMGLAVWAVIAYFGVSWVSIGTAIIFGAIVYASLVQGVFKRDVKAELQQLFKK